MNVTNTQQTEITVIAIAQDGVQTGLVRIAAGATAAVPAQAGLSLGFAAGQNWIGAPYPVTGRRGESVSVPFTPVAATAAVPAEVSRVTGPGSREITISSRHGIPVDILHIDQANQQSHVLGRLAPGGRNQLRVLPGIPLYFVETGKSEPVLRVYTVLDQATQAFEVTQSPIQARNYGPGSAQVLFRNSAPYAIAVGMRDGAGGAEALVTVPPSAVASARILAPAELIFYNLSDANAPGLPYALAAGQAEVTLPVAAAAPVAQWDATGVGINFQSAWQNPITIARVVLDQNGRPSRSVGLAPVTPGSTVPGRLAAGTLLAFFDATSGAVVGGYYRVLNQANQSVRLPYDPGAGVRARVASSTTSIELAVEPGLPALEAFVLDESGITEAKVTDLVPGQITGIRALPGTELRLRERGSGTLVGEPIAVRGQAAGAPVERYEVPYSPGSLLAGMNDPPAGPGGRPVALKATNKLNEWVRLVVVSQITKPDGQKQDVSLPLVTLPPRSDRLLQIKPLHTIYALQLPTQASVSQPYRVTPLPSAEFIISDEARDQVVGADSVPVTVNNQSTQVAFVYGRSDLGVPVLLGEVQPRASTSVRANPQELIWFVAKEGTAPFQPGREYQPLGKKVPFAVAKASGQQVSLPYEPSDADIQRLTGADLDKLADEVVKTIQKQGLDAKEQSKLANACWKNTSTRGVGTLPTTCKPGEEERGGLCYTKCRPGYRDVVTMCVPNCPAGFREDGLYCYKPAAIERRAYPWEFGDTAFSLNGARERCRRENGQNCTKIGEIIYSTCPTNYKTAPVAVNLCTPVCPAGMEDIGISCQKSTYDRGVGRLMQCPAGKLMDAGLCYQSCPAGTNGVGPVCWNQCPAKLPVECGAICARDQAACTQRVVDQVTSPLMAVGGMVLTAVTFGAGGAATATARTAAVAGKVAAQIAAKEAAKQAAKRAFTQNIRIILRQGPKEAAKITGKVLAKETAQDLAFSLVITGAIEGLQRVPWRGVNAARDDIKAALENKVRERLSRNISDAKINAMADAAFKAAEDANPTAEFPWTSLDPTGIADVVVAYNMPMCADVR